MPSGNGIDQDNKLLDGRGLGTVLSLLKGQMSSDMSDMFTFVTTTYVAKSAVTPVLVSGTTIARIDGKTIYAPAQSSSVHYARLAMDGNSELYFVNQEDTFASLKARIEAGEEVILVLPKDIINDEPGDSYAYLANLFEENPQKEIADCLAFVTPHKAGTAYVLEVYSDGYISWNSDSVSIDHIYSPVVINVSPSLTTGITIGTVTTKNLQGNYTAATLYAPAAITNYVPAEVVDGATTGFVYNAGNAAGIGVNGQNTFSEVSATENELHIHSGQGSENASANIDLSWDGDESRISILADDVSIKSVITPTNDGDAVNKKYVDDKVSGLTPYVVTYNDPVDFDEVVAAYQVGRPIYLTLFSEGFLDQYLALTDIFFGYATEGAEHYSGEMQFDWSNAYLQYQYASISEFTWSSYHTNNGTNGWNSKQTNLWSSDLIGEKIAVTPVITSGITIATIGATPIYTRQADWNITTTTNIAYIKNKPDLSNYVLASSVVSTGPTNGTAIANISGVTIYAPVAQGGVTVESDPVFTTWATGNGIAAYTITASDVEKWNGITGYVPITTTQGNVKTQFLTQSSTTGMTLRISDGNPNTHQALLKMESTNESYPKTKAQLLADDILIQGTTLTLQGVKTPTNNTDAANKKYVDDQISSVTTGLTNYVPKEVTGGTITFVPGEFAVDIQDQNENLSSIAATTNSVVIWVGEGATESAATMRMNTQNDGTHLELHAHRISIDSNDTRIEGVTTPTYPLDAANKKYVDDQISGVTSALTTYVAKTDVTPAAGITGTVIATIGGKTIYAPVSEEGIQSETDPVFSASAAAGITATDIANWNAKSSTAPVNADWSATTGLSSILNKPNLGTAATVAIDTFAAASHTHDYSKVSVTAVTTTGITIGTATVNNNGTTTTTTLYAPFSIVYDGENTALVFDGF